MARKKTRSRKPAGKAKKRHSAPRRATTRRAKAPKIARKAKRSAAAKKTGRKAAPSARSARKVVRKTRARKEVYGEGNYTATRNFDKAERAFVERNKSRIPAMAKDAEKALEGPQGNELREAEAEAASRGREDEAA